MSRIAIAIAIALLCGAMVLVPGVGLADSEATLEGLVIEMADTMEEHAALADYYRGKATEARADAAKHVQIGRSYHEGKLPQRNQMKKHCQKISDQYSEMAKEFDALAKLHDAGPK